MSDLSLPASAALVVRHPVADFDAWKSAFDEREGMRRDAGVLGYHISRDEDDPNMVSVYLAVSDLDKAKKFAASEDLQEVMQDAGVTGPPEMMWLKPVRESIVWDRELPAMMISHPVADFDAWLEGYDADADLQASGGIIGHAVNQSLDDPSMAFVYQQAESFDTLREFMANPELQAAMENSGVTAAPEVTFVTGGYD